MLSQDYSHYVKCTLALPGFELESPFYFIQR